MQAALALVPFLPLIGAAINGALALAYSHREKGPSESLVGFFACGTPLASFVLAVLLFLRMNASSPGSVFAVSLFPWLVSGSLQVDFAFAVDALSLVMVLVVTGVGTIIHFYSLGYMHGDRGFARYFSYLNLFMFSMLILVTARNLPLLFVGWEGVGLCSYLLIGFWYEDIEKAAAGKKAFVVNRVGDFAFLLGIFLIFAWTSRLGRPSLDFFELRAQVAASPDLFAPVATAAALLLFAGACGKSAQIPLYVWLPDAMAGPTPVSALIHAATMVTAGVYMVARMGFLYQVSPAAMVVVASVGTATALFAATIGICQQDIKRVLAYSTISQLGYMFAAVGVGAYAAGIFHLMTHAFFKACLFLGAGSVIHALSGEQNMLRMGGLAGRMKVTAATFMVSSLAIAGIPPLAGFFSKDEIMARVFSAGLSPRWLGPLLWGLLLAGAAVTAFYVFRAVFLTFFGRSRLEREAAAHVHESPGVMAVPLILLALGSAGAGFLGLPAILGGSDAFGRFLEPAVDYGVRAGAGGGIEAHGVEMGSGTESALMMLSVAIGLLGIAAAYYLYLKSPGLPGRLAQRLGALYRLVYNKYFVDEAYEMTIVKPGYRLSEALLFRVVDVGVIDGIVNGLGVAFRIAGGALRMVQTGVVRTYALVMVLGLIYLLYRLIT